MVSYSDSSRVLTVALAIFRAQTPQTGMDWSGLMAATLVAALPMLVLFAVLRPPHRQLHRLHRDQVKGAMTGGRHCGTAATPHASALPALALSLVAGCAQGAAPARPRTP